MKRAQVVTLGGPSAVGAFTAVAGERMLVWQPNPACHLQTRGNGRVCRGNARQKFAMLAGIPV